MSDTEVGVKEIGSFALDLESYIKETNLTQEETTREEISNGVPPLDSIGPHHDDNNWDNDFSEPPQNFHTLHTECETSNNSNEPYLDLEQSNNMDEIIDIPIIDPIINNENELSTNPADNLVLNDIVEQSINQQDQQHTKILNENIRQTELLDEYGLTTLNSKVLNIFGSSDSEGSGEKVFEGFRDSEIEMEQHDSNWLQSKSPDRNLKRKKRSRRHLKHANDESRRDIDSTSDDEEDSHLNNGAKSNQQDELLRTTSTSNKVINSDRSEIEENLPYSQDDNAERNPNASTKNIDNEGIIIPDGQNKPAAIVDDQGAPILPVLTDDDEDIDSDNVHKNRKKNNSTENSIGMISDFDVMMERKKLQNQRQRANRKRFSYYSSSSNSLNKSGDRGDFINDADDVIAALIDKMRTAWEEDRVLNTRKLPAFKKLRLLPTIIAQLRRVDLQGSFLDAGILTAFADWLQPLSDKTLPHLQIREEILKILLELPPVDVGTLKSSLIGKAVMYIYKHPKETKENKARAGKLINEWSRHIFNIPSDYKAMSKEEREERDYYLMNHFHSHQNSGENNASVPRNINQNDDCDDIEKHHTSFIGGKYGRARIPQPSARDYVIRPKSKVNVAEINQKKPLSLIKNSRMEKFKKLLNSSKRSSFGNSSTGINPNKSVSIEGRKLL